MNGKSAFDELSAQNAQIYEISGLGGPLHIVLEDGNTDDDSIRYCLKTCSNNGEVLRKPKNAELLMQLVESVGLSLLKLDERVRDDLYDNHWGMPK